MDRIVWEHPDGSIEITQALARRLDGESEADYLDRIAAETQAKVPHLAGAVRKPNIPMSALPASRAFRNAWRAGAGKVDVDMSAARGIHMAAIRAARDAKLRDLDVEQLKGADVAAAKQVLRDLPANTDLTRAETPEALEAIWPDELPARG